MHCTPEGFTEGNNDQNKVVAEFIHQVVVRGGWGSCLLGSRQLGGAGVKRGCAYPHLIHDGIGTQDVVLLGGVGGCVFDGPRGFASSGQAHHH